MEKSVLVWLGPWKQKTIPPGINVTVETGSINVLGIYTGNDYDKNIRENFYKKLGSMQTRLNLWRFRSLTLIGKIILIKSFGISNLIYSMSMTETPEKVIKEAQHMINSFIWGNGPARVKQKSLVAPYKSGGLKSPDIASQIKALRLSWISRFSENTPWCSIANLFFL